MHTHTHFSHMLHTYLRFTVTWHSFSSVSPPYYSPTAPFLPTQPVYHQYITGVIIYLICFRQFHYFSFIAFRVKSQFSDLTFGALNILDPIQVSNFVSLPLHKTYVSVMTNYIHTFPWLGRILSKTELSRPRQCPRIKFSWKKGSKEHD